MKQSFKMVFLMLVVVIIVGAGCRGTSTENTPPPQTNGTVTDPQTTPAVAPPSTSTLEGTDDLAVVAVVQPGATIVEEKPGVAKVVPTKDYGVALATYGKSGYRFQFVNCSGTPGNLNIKKGQKFMLDNRDNKTHKFKVGANTYILKAYDFAIVSVNKIGNYFLTCDGGGSATFRIQ